MASPEPEQSRSRILASLESLIEVVARLRSPEGCPWDQAQTPATLTPYILEEAYETVAAIRSGQSEEICEELGDLLLQVVLQAQIFGESGHFDLGTVAETIAAKLVRRHPHVFPDPSDPDVFEAGLTLSAGDVEHLWEQTKRAERPTEILSDRLKHYADTLPPLMAADKISRQVVKAGFEWPTVEGVWAKVAEEQAELRQALQQPTEGIPASEQARIRQQQLAELGDLLFTVVNLGRWYGLDPAEALALTNHKFARRFQYMEQQLAQDPTWLGKQLSDLDLAALDQLWQQAKQEL